MSAARTVDSRWAITIDGPAGQRLGQGLLHRGFRRGVQRRGRLVEHDDPGSAQQQAGDGQPLPLPTREPVAALAHHGVQPVGHLGDDVGQPCALQRTPQLVVGGVGRGQLQVGADRFVEQVPVLGDHADGLLQRVERHVAHVDAVDSRTAPESTS